MNLASRPTWRLIPSSTEYMLVMSKSEYEQALNKKVLTHSTASANLSGTWEIRFKRNSPKKHKALYG